MTYEDYLIHSSECFHAVYGPQPRNRRRSSNFKPKFVAKVGNRYFYSQAEYDAFKRGGRTNSSRSLYMQSVQKQRKNAKMYGPVQKTGKQKTSLKKEVQKAIQRIRPAMVRLRDTFNKTIMAFKKDAADAINRGKNVARNLISTVSNSFNSFKKNASDVIEKGKKYISDVRALKETEDLYVERSRIADARWKSAREMDKEVAEIVDRLGYGNVPERISDSRDRAHEESIRARSSAEFLWDRFQDRARQKNKSKEEFINSVLKVLGF